MMMRVLLNPATILLATMCLQWVVVTEVGTFTVLVPYLTLAFVALCTPFSSRRAKATILYLRHNWAWLAPLAVYLIIITPILLGSPAANAAPRQIFYLVGGIGVAVFIATARRIRAIFRLGAALSLLVFVGMVELLAQDLGLSWADAATQFFGSGDLDFVVFSFFQAVFNSVDPMADELINAARKNDIAGCVLAAMLLFRAGTVAPQRDFVGMGFMAAALALLIMLNDRSVLIATAASLLIATVVGAMTRPVTSLPFLAIKSVAVLALLVLAIGVALPGSGLFTTLGERFSFDDLSTASRIEQFDAALSQIESNPLTGSGYYEVNGYAIHNVFLGAWVQAGLVAFLLSVAFYFVILVRWISSLVTFTSRPDRWVLPVAFDWIAPLPLLPLFRAWLSGEGGVFKFGEWIALSVFFGCLLANHVRLRAGARLANPQPARPMPAGAAAFPAQ